MPKLTGRTPQSIQTEIRELKATIAEIDQLLSGSIGDRVRTQLLSQRARAVSKIGQAEERLATAETKNTDTSEPETLDELVALDDTAMLQQAPKGSIASMVGRDSTKLHGELVADPDRHHLAAHVRERYAANGELCQQCWEPLQNVVEALPYDRPLAIKPEQVHQVAYRGSHPDDELPSVDYLVATSGFLPRTARGMDAKNGDENPYLAAYAPAVEHFKIHGELPLGVAHGRVTPCLPARTARS